MSDVFCKNDLRIKICANGCKNIVLLFAKIIGAPDNLFDIRRG